MPQALSTDGQAVDVAPEELVAKWKANEVQPIAGEKYHVRMPTGEYFTVPGESLSTSVSNGGRIVSESEVQQHREQVKYGGLGGAATAFATGAVEQGTLGLGAELYPESWKPGIEASQRLHPVVHGTGEVAGIAGLSAVLPGGGVAGAIGRAGAGVVEGAGESALARIAARSALGGLKEAATGAQMGVAQAISDNAIADHNLTAAQMLAAVKANAMWGGALGAGFGAVGGLLSRTGEAAKPEVKAAIEEALSKGASDADVEAVAARAIGAPEAAPGLGAKVRKLYARIASAVSGGDREAIEKFVGEEGYANRQSLLEAETARDEASRAIREHVNTVLEANRAVQEEGQGTLKRGYVRKAVADVDPALASQSARGMTDNVMSSLDAMVKAPEDFGGAAPLKRAMTIATKASAKLDAAIEAGDVAEQFGIVDDLKKAIGKYTKGASKLSPGAATDELISLQNRARASGLQEIYENLRTGLEDESVWKKAASDQKSINRAWTTQIDASNRFHSALTTDIGRDPSNPWVNIRGVDPAKADSYVRNLTNPSQDLTHQAVTDYVGSTKRLAETMSEAYDMPAPKLAEVKRLGDAADAFRDTLDKTTSQLQLVNQFEQLKNLTTGHGSGWAATVGALTHGLAGGLEGMALGKVAGVFTRPAEHIMKLARVEQMMRESDSRILRSLRGFSRGAGGNVTRTPVEAFGRKAAQVRTLTDNPALLGERVSANIGPLHETAPKLATALTQTSLAGLKLLRDKMPATLPPDPLDPMRKPPPPPASQRAAWLRYYDAVTDPHSVTDDLKAGRINLEGVEVLKTVYPPLYERTRMLAQQEMASGRMKDLTSQQRVVLGMSLDLPLPELAPDYVAARQATFSQADQAAQSQAQASEKTGGGGKSKSVHLMKAATPPQTASDRVESGGAGT